MEKLPENPAILVSAINMLLRDEEFDSLHSLCCNFEVNQTELRRKLLTNGYEFSQEQLQFRPIGYNENSINRNSVELAYSFFHQKYRVFEQSNMEWQKEDIEYAISQYAYSMPQNLYELLSCGQKDFLQNHSTFAFDIKFAIEIMENLLENNV